MIIELVICLGAIVAETLSLRVCVCVRACVCVRVCGVCATTGMSLFV